MGALYLHAAVDRVSRDLVRDGWSTGRRYSAGQNVAVGATHDWVVVTRRGRVVVLAHDAFEAALYLAELEAGVMDPPRKALARETDAEVQHDRWERWWASCQYGPYGLTIWRRSHQNFLGVLTARAANISSWIGRK